MPVPTPKQLYRDARPVDGTGRFAPAKNTHRTGIARSTHREGSTGRSSTPLRVNRKKR